MHDHDAMADVWPLHIQEHRRAASATRPAATIPPAPHPPMLWHPPSGALLGRRRPSLVPHPRASEPPPTEDTPVPTESLRSNDAIPALRATLQAVGRSAFARGLVWGTSGNISGKLPDGTLLMSKAGTDLADLADDGFVVAAPGFDDEIPA